MTEPTQTIVAKSLEDLGEETVVVTIPKPNGALVSVVLRVLSEQDIWDIRHAMTWPKPPVDLQKVNGAVKRIPNYDDSAYLEAVRVADRDFSIKILMAALVLDIPGETEDERIKTLRKRMGQRTFNFLVDAVNKLTLVSEEEVQAMADSFRRVRPATPAGHDPAGADSGSVAEPAA